MSAFQKTRLLGIAATVGSALSFMSTPAHANVTVFDKDDWKFSVGGFIETDAISDSTRSFREVIGNSPVKLPNSLDGNAGRTQFSIRNSRLAFTLDAPVISGWSSKAYFEFDFLGFDAPPNTSAPANNSEGSYYTSPTLRVRHAFMQAENDGFQVLAGQYWNLFGWQPYYFLAAVDVSPLSAQIYSRNAQFRALKAIKFSDQDVLQVAAAVVRPPQADSRYPSIEAGARLAMGERSSGFTGSATGDRKTQPMSVGISGTARDFATPVTGTSTTDTEHYTGYALAAEAMIPILASSDGKDVANTLSLLGEFSVGTGYGDIFSGWNGGSANPLNTSANSPAKNTTMDGGIGDYDVNGAFHLFNLRTFNVHAQYHLPEFMGATFIDAGYTNLFSNNLASIANSGPNANQLSSSVGTANFAYDRQQNFFANIFHDCTPQIRVGFEFVHVKTDYVANLSAVDNRYQASAYYRF
jgi:hypothetical protein